MKEAAARVKVYKEHATINKFDQMLAKKPNAIHFSGHGTEKALILEDNNDASEVLLD